MPPQIACPRESIVTLVASIWLFSTVCFQMIPQIACWLGFKVALVAFVWLSLFSNVPSNFPLKRMHSRIGCICLAFPHFAFANRQPAKGIVALVTFLYICELFFLSSIYIKRIKMDTYFQTLHIVQASLHCEWSYVSFNSDRKWANILFLSSHKVIDEQYSGP